MSEMIKNHLWDEYREYVDKYPIYPQVTLRLSFRAL